MKSKITQITQIKYAIVLLFFINGSTLLFAQSFDLIVIDKDYAQKEKLLAKLPSNVSILNLNGSGNPWKIIRETLQQDPNLKNIHLFAEFGFKSLLIGGIEYNEASLDTDFEIAMLEGLYTGTHYQLLLYTCNLASNSEGLDFMRKLGNGTYFNVAASTNCNDIFSSNLSFDFTTFEKLTVSSIFNN